MYICKPEDLQELKEIFENEPAGTHILMVGSIHVLTTLYEYAKENDTTIEDITQKVIKGKLNYMSVNGVGYIVKNLENIV